MAAVQAAGRASCAVCTSSASYWFSKNGHKLYRCSRCGLVFVHPAPASTRQVYGEDYFCGAAHGFGYGDYDQDKAADGAFERYLDVIEQRLPARGRLLDVGAATGRFVEAAARRGWKAAGVEVSDYAAEQARKRGLDVATGVLEEQPYADGSFDVVTMWDVFEHVADPAALLATARRITAPGGLLVINTPDAGSLYARVAGKRWQLIVPPEHLALYNRLNLRVLLKRAGYAVLDQRRIGKSFRPSYVVRIVSSIRGSRWLERLATRIRGSRLDRLALPINLRDNTFVLAERTA